MLKVMRYNIRVLTLFSPFLAASLVNYLWFRTHRHDEPRREKKLLESAKWETAVIEAKHVQVYIWGDDASSTVLISHGWNGRGAQLGSFIPDLVKQGFRVVAYDAPGHGRSSSKSTSLPEISQVIQQLAKQYGPFYAGIAHSFGGLCLVNAVSSGVNMDKIVCIASAFNVERLVEFFAKLMEVQPKIVERQKRLLEQQFGEGIWEQYSMPNMLSNIAASGLVIHDQDDDAVPVERSKMIAQAWDDSRLLLTTGLGHRRVLRDKAVIKEVVEFISAE